MVFASRSARYLQRTVPKDGSEFSALENFALLSSNLLCSAQISPFAEKLPRSTFPLRQDGSTFSLGDCLFSLSLPLPRRRQPSSFLHTLPLLSYGQRRSSPRERTSPCLREEGNGISSSEKGQRGLLRFRPLRGSSSQRPRRRYPLPLGVWRTVGSISYDAWIPCLDV